MTPKQTAAVSASLDDLRRTTAPLVIFGAGIVGEVLLRACNDAGIAVTCFCDNNINKTKTPFCDTPVLHTAELRTKYPEAAFLISAADIKDVVEQLAELGYSQWYGCNVLLRDYDINSRRFSAPQEFVEYAIDTSLLCHDSYLEPEKLFLRSVDIIITERCSLKCRDCSNLMQYYPKPQNIDIAEITGTIDAFCSLVDEVNEFRIIGGEPFMNRDIHLVIKRLIEEPRVKRIVIFTNGTILPRTDQIEFLQHKKVILLVTDYGELAKNLSRFTEILKTNQVAFFTRKAQGWTDCAVIAKHERTEDQQKTVFKQCCAKNLATLSSGKLYRCPFSANADRLRAIPSVPQDHVDIVALAASGGPTKEKKGRIRSFLLDKAYLMTCNYCKGRPLEAPEIQPAIQLRAPLPYTTCR